MPSVIKRRLRARCIAEPTQTRNGDAFVDLAFERQTERGPTKDRVRPQNTVTLRDNVNVLRIWIPLGPPGGLDDVLPDPLARSVDHRLVVGKQIRLLRFESGRPVDVAIAIR